MHKKTKRFQKCFDELPESIQKIAHNQFKLLKNNKSHPSLHFKKVGKFWSVRVGINYRALAIQESDDYIWVWIGSHDDYDKLLN